MKDLSCDDVLQTISRLRQLFPEWRLGQLMANLLMASGYSEIEAIWDVEDEQLLAAAQRLIARNSDRCSAQA
jgi:hypothetical protein